MKPSDIIPRFDAFLGDCLALAPRAEELHQAEAWIAAQDLNPDWPAHVEATLKDLARRLEHGL